MPVASPEKTNGAVDGIDGASAGFEQQRLKQRRSLRFRDGGDEGHEAGAAEELSDEDSSVTLSFGGVNPLQTRAKNTGFAAALTKNTATVATHGCEMEMGCGMEKKEEMR